VSSCTAGPAPRQPLSSPPLERPHRPCRPLGRPHRPCRPLERPHRPCRPLGRPHRPRRPLPALSLVCTELPAGLRVSVLGPYPPHVEGMAHCPCVWSVPPLVSTAVLFLPPVQGRHCDTSTVVDTSRRHQHCAVHQHCHTSAAVLQCWP
jgi:hypothetical protein